VNLKRLEQLIAVAEEGSVAAAARRVHLSQPALTRSIQVLEEEAGLQLCDRGARGATLTAAGRMVVARAQRILFETRCLRRDLTLLRQHVIGSVQVGFGPFAAASLLPELLCNLHRDWPKLNVTADINDASVLLQALHAEMLDLMVVSPRVIPQTADLEVHRLRPEQAGFFVRASHPLCGAGQVTPTQLREAALVSAPFPPRGQAALRKLLGCRSDDKLPFRLESNDLRALTHLACHSDAILLAPVRALRTEVAAGALVQLEIGDSDALALQFAVVHLAQRTLSPAALRTLEALHSLTS
jgi:DNA-binding transcriptional LysR family regulator